MSGRRFTFTSRNFPAARTLSIGEIASFTTLPRSTGPPDCKEASIRRARLRQPQRSGGGKPAPAKAKAPERRGRRKAAAQRRRKAAAKRASDDDERRYALVRRCRVRGGALPLVPRVVLAPEEDDRARVARFAPVLVADARPVRGAAPRLSPVVRFAPRAPFLAVASGCLCPARFVAGEAPRFAVVRRAARLGRPAARGAPGGAPALRRRLLRRSAARRGGAPAARRGAPAARGAPARAPPRPPPSCSPSHPLA